MFKISVQQEQSLLYGYIPRLVPELSAHLEDTLPSEWATYEAEDGRQLVSNCLRQAFGRGVTTRGPLKRVCEISLLLGRPLGPAPNDDAVFHHLTTPEVAKQWPLNRLSLIELARSV